MGEGRVSRPVAIDKGLLRRPASLGEVAAARKSVPCIRGRGIGTLGRTKSGCGWTNARLTYLSRIYSSRSDLHMYMYIHVIAQVQYMM